ncbi:WD40-repeat-containing domain protein [Aspergillus udagawae]|nr:WD40-repeat-containing domain protein [Aspergillus udagawae]
MPCPAREEFQIGWICALVIEAAAAKEMLDEDFGILEEQDAADTNAYRLGRIGKHHVVIACLPGGQYGACAATTVANNMVRTFSKSLRIGLMVGVGGGIPSADHDIRLGDIVISSPTGRSGGVVQYDMGKVTADGVFCRTGSLSSPPRSLLTAVNNMRSAELTDDPRYPEYLQRAIRRTGRTLANFGRPSSRSDRLFKSKYEHPATAKNCDTCPREWEESRCERDGQYPLLHYGIIASGNSVIKHGCTREQLRLETGALCFEMEAAGLMQDFPCIVIRGICDYADSHKNKQWQGYAALAAASYTKELLGYVPRGQVSQVMLVTEISTIGKRLENLTENADNINQKLDFSQLQIAKGAAFNSYENKHAECLPGTRSDLLHQVKEWAESPQGKCIFWLNGMAGTGKSTISRTISRHFKEQGVLGASFFFKRGEEDRGNARRLFPTLVKQLATSIPQLIPTIQEAIADDANISERVLREQFERLLLQPLLKMKKRLTTTMVIVIDALDECDQDDDVGLILRLLPRVQRSNSVKLRFLLTSRPELPIRFGFKEIADAHQDLVLHQIPTPVIEHDISLFFQVKLAQLRERRSLSPDWPGSERIKALTERAAPLFISAATIYRFISDEKWNPETRLQGILANHTNHSTYVSKMDGTYMTVLNQLLTGQDERESQQLVQEFKDLVGGIILLATPLSAVALSRLVNLDLNHINRRLNPLHSVLHVPSNPSTPVRLLHLSFRDFLLDIKMKKGKECEQFWIDEKAVHGYLTRQCLELMRCSLKKNICDLPNAGIHRSEIDVQSIDHHLPAELQYACRYWAEHLTLCQDPLYSSGLLFAPENSLTRKIFHEELENQRRLRNAEESWGAELQALEGHAGQVNSVSFSRDGQLLASASADRTIKLWDPTTGELRQTLEGHSDWAHSVSFSPDSQLLASASGDRTIKLWDPTTGELRQTLEGHSVWINSVSFSPDGQLLASASDDRTINLWNPITGELRQTLEGHSDSAYQVTYLRRLGHKAQVISVRQEKLFLLGDKCPFSQFFQDRILPVVERPFIDGALLDLGLIIAECPISKQGTEYLFGVTELFMGFPSTREALLQEAAITKLDAPSQQTVKGIQANIEAENTFPMDDIEWLKTFTVTAQSAKEGIQKLTLCMNVTQHTKRLKETLSLPSAIWNVCSVMLPNVPQTLDVGLQYQTIHIEAYVVYIDMAYANTVAFKLTTETINTLVKFHRDVYSVYAWLGTWEWSGKEN